jgi:muramidase (phage lysozyme)
MNGRNGTRTVNAGLRDSQRALLDAIAGTESPGYNTMYGGAAFNGYDSKPRTGIKIDKGPNKGKISAAAGRYQFNNETWDQEQAALSLPNFSPENQDLAAFHLAATTYAEKTGRDLTADLESGDPSILATIGSTLSGRWTSLPGGIEQNAAYATSASPFAAAINKSLGYYGAAAQASLPQAAAHIPGASPDNAERLAEREADIAGRQKPMGAALGAFAGREPDAQAKPPTLGEQMRSLLGLPAQLSEATAAALESGVVSLGQLAAEVAANSAAAQNPQNAPPSSFPGRPDGPISTNQTSAALPGNVQRASLPGINPNAGIAGAAPASDMRDTPAGRMHAALAAEGVKGSYDPQSGRVSFGPIGPQAAADAAGPPAAAGGLGGLLGTIGRSVMSSGSSAPAAPAYGGPTAAADRAGPKSLGAKGGYTSSPQAYGGPTAAADASNRAQPLSSLGLPSGMKTDYAGLDVGSLSQDGIAPDLGASPAATMAERTATQQALADYDAAVKGLVGPAPGTVSNKKPGELGYQAPTISPKVAAPAMAKPAAAVRPAAPAKPAAPSFANGTGVYDDAGGLVGTMMGGRVQAPSFADGTAVTDQSGHVVGTIGSDGKTQGLGFFGSIANALGLGPSATGLSAGQSGSHGGQNSSGSTRSVSAGQIGGISGRNGTTSGLGGGRAGNDSGQQHG